MNLEQLEQALSDLPKWEAARIGRNSEQKVEEPERFVKGHLRALKSNPGNKRYLPYFNRLKQFYEAQKKEV